MRQKAVNLIFAALCLVVAMYFVFGEIFLPSDSLDEEAVCARYTGQWERIAEDGTRAPAAVPGKCEAGRDEMVAVETVLPDVIENGRYLCFRSAKQDMKFYIDGELKKEYSTEGRRLFGRMSAAAYVFVSIDEEDAGKTLRVEMKTDSSYTGMLYTVYYGNPMGVWKYFFEKMGLELVVAFVTLILSIISMIGSVTLWFCYRRKVALFYLGSGIFVAAVWLITNSTFRQLIFPNLSVINDITFLMIMLLALPFLLYMNEVQKDRYGRGYRILESIVIANFFLCSLLHMTEICDFTDTIRYVSALCVISIVWMIVTILLDVRKGKIGEYRFVAIGMLGICVAAFAQILIYFHKPDLFNGVILALGLIFLLGFSTISTIHEIMDMEREKQQALLASESKGRFLAKMSHEHRTPIHAVLGMDAMILRESGEPAIREYALDIKNAGQTLLSLINDILDISKIESGKLEILPVRYDLSSLINDVVNMMKMRAKDKGLELKLFVDPQIPSGLFGDDVRIRQILVNLLSNAVKYTEAGSVVLSVEAVLHEDTAALTFRVEDTGIGIRESDLEKLCQEFERIEEQRNRKIEGTGLGMNITTQLLELMGSSLQVESVYGQGSVFSFTLEQKIMSGEPVGDLARRIKEQAAAYSDRVLFTAPEARLLVVDDNAVNRRVFVKLLKATRIRVDEASGGEECLELARKNAYDLIFLDHMMPDLDGITVLHKMREWEEYPSQSAPVIALTANAVTGAREMYLNEGFDGFLSKPVNPEKMEKMIMQFLPEEKVVLGGAESVSHEEETVWPELDGIDWNYAQLYCRDAAILRETVDLFYQTLESEAAQLEHVLALLERTEEMDREALEHFRIQVHSMKNSAAMIGAVPLSGVAKMLEYAARDGKTDVIGKLTPVFLQEWRHMKVVLKPILEQETKDDKKEELDRERTKELLCLLRSSVEEMDVDAADEIIRQLKRFSFPEKIMTEVMEKLCLAVIDLDEQQTAVWTGKFEQIMEESDEKGVIGRGTE